MEAEDDQGDVPDDEKFLKRTLCQKPALLPAFFRQRGWGQKNSKKRLLFLLPFYPYK